MLIEESIDITKHKHLDVYVQIIDPESFQPSNHFVANKECVGTINAGTIKCIQKVISELENLINQSNEHVIRWSCHNDKEKNIGCTGILLRFNPQILNITLSLVLCTSQAPAKTD